MYVIAFLDRSNVSFAQKEFEVDFGISAAAYAFGAGLFFVGYAIFEVPSNLLLHKVGARWWLARIMVSWGIIAAAFMFVQGPNELLHPAVPARCRRGGLLPRRHPLPHLLDPRAAPEPGARLLLYGHRDRRHPRQPAVRRAAGAQRVVRASRHSVDVPHRGFAGRRRGRLVLLLPDRQARRTRSGCRTTSGRRWRRPSPPRTPPRRRGTDPRRCSRRSATGGCGTSR